MANTLKFGNGEWYGKKDTILAYNDLNSNYKPLPFNFSRASKATVINKDGLIEEVGSGQPRVDYLNNTKGALKLEPTRTNKVIYSNGFTDSSWLPTGATVVSGVISPDGTSNAFTLSNTASSGIIQKAVSLTGLRVVSIFAKKGTHRYLRIGAYGGTNSYANFDLENGVVADGANANIEDYGNGWFRCICHSADGATGGVQIFPSNNTTGAATTNGSIQIYGVQLEEGSYATSYIPTSGSAVTRLADSCSQTVPDGVIGQTEGTVFLDVDFIDIDAVEVLISVHDGASNKRLEIWANGSVVNGFIGGSVNIGIGNTTISEGRHKLALAYNQLGDQAFYVDGVQVGTSSTAYTIAALTQLSYSTYSGSLAANESVNQVQLYNTRLSNSELAALTQV